MPPLNTSVACPVFDKTLTKTSLQAVQHRALSNITIKQVSKDGQVREYYAQEFALSADSRYFYKASTDNFRMSISLVRFIATTEANDEPRSV